MMIVPISLNIKQILLIETFLAESNKYRRKPMSRSEAVRILIENGAEWFMHEKVKYSATPYEKLSTDQKNTLEGYK